MSAAIPPAPALRDPVVVGGTKYRIAAITGRRTVVLHDRFAGGVRPNGPEVDLSYLTWDPVAGVWRVPPWS